MGIAWEYGIAAGLAEEGVLLGEADLIVGTSAGSVVGAHLALGRDPRSLVEVQLNRVAREGEAPSGRERRPPDFAGLMQQMGKLASGDRPAEEVRAEIGAFALAADTGTEEEFIAGFGRMYDMGAEAWPARRFVCTAVDAQDGSFVTWDNDSGVPLARAVASSCAVPGAIPPITVNGRRYIDGGMRSGSNADLAAGSERVVVVSLMGGGRAASDAALAARFEMMAKRFERELESLRESGSTVAVVVPDDESRAAMGVNLMDARRNADAARAGIRQGKREASHLKSFWS